MCVPPAARIQGRVRDTIFCFQDITASVAVDWAVQVPGICRVLIILLWVLVLAGRRRGDLWHMGL